MAQQVRYDLTVNANVQQAKAAIMELQRDLQNLAVSTPTRAGYELPITKQVVEAQKAANLLKISLQNATNVNTGKLNLTKFQQQLNETGMTLADYRQHFSALGTAGQETFVKLTQSVMSSNTAFRTSNKLVNSLWITLKNTAKWQISATTLRALTGGFQTAFDYAESLNKSLNQIQIVTQNSTEQMARFAKQANIAAKELSTTTTAYSDAALIYYQQGLNDDEVKARTDITVKAANAAGASAEEMSDYLTAVWNSYKVGSDELERYVDIMAALGAGTATSLEEISTAMEKVAAVGESTGIKFEQLSSIIATVSSVTRQSAETVGTAYKTIFARMEDLKLEGSVEEDGVTTTLGTVSKQLAQVGVNVLDAQGELRETGEVIDELMDKWSNMNDATRQAVAIAVAGKRQYTSLLALMNNQDMYREALSMATGSSGTLQKQADVYAEGWEAAQKRVKSSAQGIYDSLINDKLFINANNSLAAFLETIEKIVDAIGGLKGVLSLLGITMTTVFGEKIASSIGNFTLSLFSTTKAARQANEELRQQALEETINVMGYGEATEQEQKYWRETLSLRQQFSEQQDKMNASAREFGELIIQQAEAISQHAIAASKEAQASQQQVQDNEAIMLKSLNNQNQREYAINSSIFAQAANERLQNANLSGEQMAVINKTQIGTGGTREDVQRAFEVLNETGLVTEERLKAVNQELNNFSNKTKSEISQSLKKLREEINRIINPFETLREVLTNIEGLPPEAIQAINNYIDSLQQATKDAKKMEEADKAVEEAVERLREAMRNLPNSFNVNPFQEFGKNINTALRGISMFGMGLSTLNGVWNTLKNEDMSFFEKFTTSITSLSMGLPMLIGGMSQFINVTTKLKTSFIDGANAIIGASVADQLKNNLDRESIILEGILIEKGKEREGIDKLSTGTKLKYIIAQRLGLKVIADENGKLTFNTAKKSENLVVTQLQTIAQAFLNGEILTGILLLGQYLLAVGAIVAVIWGMVAAYKAIKENSPEEQLKRLNEEIDEASNQLENAKNNLQEFKDGLSDFDEGISNIATLTEGTEAWSDAILKANEQATALLDKYPKLAKGMKIDSSGLIQFDKEVEKEVQSDLRNIQVGSLGNYMNKVAQRDRLQLDIDISGLAKQEGYFYNEDERKYDDSIKYLAEKISYQNSWYDEKIIRKVIDAYNNSDEIKKSTFFTGENNWKNILGEDWSSDIVDSIYEEKDEIIKLANKASSIDSYVQSISNTLNQEASQETGSARATGFTTEEAEKQAEDKVWANFKWNNKGFNFDANTSSDSKDAYMIKLIQDYIDANYANQGYTYTGTMKNKGDVAVAKKRGTNEEITITENELFEFDKARALGKVYSEEDYKLAADNLQRSFNEGQMSGLSQDTQIILDNIEQLFELGYGEDYLVKSRLWGTDEYGDEGYQEEEIRNSGVGRQLFESLFGGNPGTGLIEVDDQSSEQITELANSFANINFQSADAREEILKLTDSFKNGKISLDEYKTGLEEIGAASKGIENEAENIQELSKAYDLESEEITNYANYLMEASKNSDILSRDLAKNANGAAKLATEVLRMNRGVETLGDNFEEWSDILKNSSKESQEFYEAATQMKEALADVLNVSSENISSDFIVNNLKDIEKAAKGDADAINQLGISLGKDIILNTRVALNDEEIKEQLSTQFDELINSIPDDVLSVGVNGEINNEDFINACQAIINSADMTAQEANDALQAIGFTPTFTTEPQEVQTTVEKYRTTEKLIESGVVEIPGEDGTPVRTVPYYTTETEVTPLTPEVITTTQEVTALSTDGTKPKIDKLYKSAPGSLNNASSSNKGGKSSGGSKGGGGGGGSKKSTPQKTESKRSRDEVERYKNTNNALDSQQRTLDQIDRLKSRVYGRNYLQAIDDENKALQSRNAILSKGYEEAQKYFQQDLALLQGGYSDTEQGGFSYTLDIQLDDEGFLLNEEQLMDYLKVQKTNELQEWYDNAINSLGEDDEEGKQAIEDLYKKRQQAIEDSVEDVSNLAEANEQMYKMLTEREKNLAQIRENNYEKLTRLYKDFFTQIDQEIKLYETLKNSLEESIENAPTSFQYDINKYDAVRKSQVLQNAEFATAKDLYNLGLMDSEKYVEVINNTIDAAFEWADTISEQFKAMNAIISDTLSQIGEEYDYLDDRVSHLVDVTDDYLNIMKLLGKSTNYKELNKLYQTQADLQKTNFENQKLQYETYANSVKMLQDTINDPNANEAAKDVARKNLKEMQEQAEEAYSAMLESAESYSEALQEVLSNSIAEALDAYERGITGGRTLNELNEELDYLRAKQEEYLTETNKQYETEKLIRQANLDISNTDNEVAQRKLELFKKETEQLQKQNKLSNFELEVQKAKYELLLAEIALQDAQDAKSQVRLRKDSEGNFNYVYTADKDKIAEAEEKYADAENNLYNIRLNGANEYAEKYVQLFTDLQDKMREIAEDEALTTEEKNERMQEEYERYYSRLLDIQSIYGIAAEGLGDKLNEAWSTDMMENVATVEEWDDVTSQSISDITDALETYQVDVSELSDLIEDDFDTKLTESAKDYAEQMKDTAKQANSSLEEIWQNVSVNAERIRKAYDNINGELQEYIKYLMQIRAIESGADFTNTDYAALILDPNTSFDLAVDQFELREAKKNYLGLSEDSIENGLLAGYNYDFAQMMIDNAGLDVNAFLKAALLREQKLKSQGAASTTEGLDKIIQQVKDKLAEEEKTIDWWLKEVSENKGDLYDNLLKVLNGQSITGLASGGYTGEFGPQGKLAVLHEKELVLNADDTKNILDSVDLVDKLINNLEFINLISTFGSTMAPPRAFDSGNLEQYVEITAEFPNATDHNEIEEAFRNLTNTASQYANRKDQ